MSHPDYVKIGAPEDKVMEECAELIKAICKAKRFGNNNFNPKNNKPNRVAILEEMKDVERAIKRYKKELKKEN